MKVESIPECSLTFDLHKAVIGLENLCPFFIVAVLHMMYCICFIEFVCLI